MLTGGMQSIDSPLRSSLPLAAEWPPIGSDQIIPYHITSGQIRLIRCRTLTESVVLSRAATVHAIRI